MNVCVKQGILPFPVMSFWYSVRKWHLLSTKVFSPSWCQREGNPQPVPTEASHSAYNNFHSALVPFLIQENFPFNLVFKVFLGIYRLHMALKRLKSNVAFLEAKMLLFYFFFLNCCFSVSMGSAIEEFQENFKALVELANQEVGHSLFLFIFYSSLDGVWNHLWASSSSSSITCVSLLNLRWC